MIASIIIGLAHLCELGRFPGRRATVSNIRTKEIMSDAHNEHESAIQTPKQLVAAVIGFFAFIVIGIILLVYFVTTEKLTGAGTEALGNEAVAARIAPIADEGFTLKDPNAPRVFQTGEAVYTSTCLACHGSGAAGAPKTGDVAAWAPRLAQGYDTVVKNAIEGIRAMPAKGGNPDLDNYEVARAVVFMANQSGAKYQEPAAPAAPVAAAEASPSPAAAEAALEADAARAAGAAAQAPVVPPTAPVAAVPAIDGKKVYDASCVACHGTGIAGAPKVGDKAAWAARIKQGDAILYDHAIKGFTGKTGMMPPKGGSTAPDADIKAAVDYMVGASK